MEGKEITSGKAPSDRLILSRDLVVTAGDLSKHKASSSGPYADATAGDGVMEMLRRLQLTCQESNTFVLDDEAEDDLGCPEWALAGKVLAPNTLHISTIKAALQPAWGNPKGIEMHVMGRNLFLAEFATKADKTRITEGSPWIVAKPKQSRQSKPRNIGKNAPGSAAAVVKEDGSRISGQKRKEYRPKAVAPSNAGKQTLPSTEVPVGALMLVTAVTPATEGSGDDQVEDYDSSPHKKHKTDVSLTSSRSVDLAATAEKSHPTQ
ncbi:hypothetical protein ACQ4PT_019000 [Festuca glaucescens]